MTPAIQAWVKARIDDGTLKTDVPTLEVGSRDVNGGVRHLFRPGSFYGVDIEPGPGVDRLISPHQDLDIECWEQVICLEVLEHDTRPTRTLANMQRTLEHGGKLVISVPANGFPEHRYPLDLFRYMPDAFPHFFFKGMKTIRVDAVTCPAGYPGLIGVAEKL